MYSSTRKCPPEYKEGFEDILKELVNSFSESWLKSNEGHEIQKLWDRNDMIASDELITLGESIIKLNKVNSKWVEEQIKLIKNKDPNRRRGPIYEIILAAALHDVNSQTVELLSLRNQTYDLILDLSDESKIYISVKNYGLSDKAKIFNKNAEMITNIIKSNPICPPMKFFININERYPNSEDWISLRRYLLHILRNKFDLSKNHVYQYTIGNWNIGLRPIDVENLYERNVSYTILITAPFYKNEEMRLYSNLNKASKDLEKNGCSETNQNINVLFAHIPSVVSLGNYEQWSHNYLRENPDSPISGIILLQPTIAYDDNGDLFIALSQKSIFRPETSTNWFGKYKRSCQFHFSVGIPTENSNETYIKLYNKDILINAHYLYQSGNVYYYYDSDELLKKQSNVKMRVKYGFGIHTHSVFKLGGEEKILSGNFPPKDELLLL